MTILEKAVEIASILDPSLGLELEQEFGKDWQGKLANEIKGIAKEKKLADEVKKASQTEFKRRNR